MVRVVCVMVCGVRDVLRAWCVASVRGVRNGCTMGVRGVRGECARSVCVVGMRGGYACVVCGDVRAWHAWCVCMMGMRDGHGCWVFGGCGRVACMIGVVGACVGNVMGWCVQWGVCVRCVHDGAGVSSTQI